MLSSPSALAAVLGAPAPCHSRPQNLSKYFTEYDQDLDHIQQMAENGGKCQLLWYLVEEDK